MASSCPNCGYENPAAARFCSSCGTPLHDRSDVDSTEAFDFPQDPELADLDVDVDFPEGTVGMFVVRQGPKKGSRIALDSEEISIGRHPESDIFLDDVTVSRRHAMVRRNGGGYVVYDAGSLNGTYINQERVEEQDLSDGDEVQVGKFKLVYLALTRQD